MVRKLTENEIQEIRDNYDEFLESFESLVMNTEERMLLIYDFRGFITELTREYYNLEFDPVRKIMNSLLDVMSTSKFASGLKALLESDEFEDYRDYKYPLAETISILSECQFDRMAEETVNTYVWTILRRIWREEINQLLRSLEITEELALQLLIGIPKAPRDIQSWELGRFVSKFKQALKEHSNITENQKVLGAATMKSLLNFFFDSVDNPKTKLHAIGRLLGQSMDAPEDMTQWSQPIYTQFIKMLYTALNEYDIKEIRGVLDFIIKRNKIYAHDHMDKALFNLEEACEFSNIKTAIKTMIERDESIKKFL